MAGQVFASEHSSEREYSLLRVLHQQVLGNIAEPPCTAHARRHRTHGSTLWGHQLAPAAHVRQGP